MNDNYAIGVSVLLLRRIDHAGFYYKYCTLVLLYTYPLTVRGRLLRSENEGIFLVTSDICRRQPAGVCNG